MSFIKKLPKSWTTVTPLSRMIALILFGLLPVCGYLFGMSMQKTIDNVAYQQSFKPVPVLVSPAAVQPTPIVIDTATWKSYTDRQYHYSIKLPPEFVGYIPTKGYTGANADPDNTGRMQFEDSTLTGNYPNRTAKYGFSIQIGFADSNAPQCTTDEECYMRNKNFYHNTIDGMHVIPIKTSILNRTIKGLAIINNTGINYFYDFAVNGKRFSCVIQFYYPKGFKDVQQKEPYINTILSTLTFN